MLKRIAVLCSFLLVSISCEKKSTTNTPSNPPSANFSAKINGSVFPPAGTRADVAVYSVDTALNTATLGIGLSNLSADLSHQEVISLIAVTNSASGIVAGDVFSGVDTSSVNIIHHAVGVYSDVIIPGQIVRHHAESDMNCTISITKHDQTAGTFSGKFEFTAIDDSTNIQYEVLEGVFTDVSYN